MKKRLVILFCVLLVAAAGSSAMSLGQLRGAALISRPLDIAVQATLDAQADLAALCAQADVFYADNKLSASRVQITTNKNFSSGQEATIRIRSSVPVDEPVVSIVLQIGCQQKTERRYVLLADLAPESGGAVPAQAGQNLTGTGIAANRRTGAANATSAGGSTATPLLQGVPAGRGERAQARAGAAQMATGSAAPTSLAMSPTLRSAAVQKRAAKGATARREKAANARLKLEPIDLALDRDPQLKPSTELAAAPSADAQIRSAAAALWRALTAQPQDMLRDAEKLQALESSVRSLQAQNQASRLAIDDLNAMVLKAQSERYANALVYALAALLLLTLLVIAYMARRFSSPRNIGSDELPWWRKKEPLEKGWGNSSLDAASPSLFPEGDDVSKALRPPQPSADASGVDLDLNLGAGGPAFKQARSATRPAGANSLFPLSRHDRPEFTLSINNPARAIKAEELFDVQQQADFFVSLGQYEQAIEVLRHHIEVNVQTSALVYLDLFKLYHELKRQEDYEALREDFNQRFNGNIPPFALYGEAGPGLEAHQGALTRIEALWPSPKVLEIIEESLFRKPGDGAEAFDLEAYRELLILYAVAREIISPEPASNNAMLKFDLPPGAGDPAEKTIRFLATSIQPLSAGAGPGHFPPATLDLSLPPASSRLGLDLDLSEAPGESMTPAAESDSRFFAQFAADIPIDPPVSAQRRSAETAGQPQPGKDNLMDIDSFDPPGDGETPPQRPRR